MSYDNDKHVVFSLIKRVDYNKSVEDIMFDLGYDMGDYNFGKGDNQVLREKIINSILFLKTQFDGVFDDQLNTK